MAKLNLADIKTAAASYVDATKQLATTRVDVADDITGLVNKIGKIVNLRTDLTGVDILPELDGEEMTHGRIIEEYALSLRMPEARDKDGKTTLAPRRPGGETKYWSFPLVSAKIANKDYAFGTWSTTVDHNKYQQVSLGESTVQDIVGQIVNDLYGSFELSKYAAKKQLLLNAVGKANTASRFVTIDKPVDEATSEAFVKALKKELEKAKFIQENANIAGTICKPQSLVLYIQQGVVPELELMESKIFNLSKVTVPVEIIPLDIEFPTGYYGVLLDPRGVKLYQNYKSTRTQENAEGDFTNYFLHADFTGFISGHTFIKTLKEAA